MTQAIRPMPEEMPVELWRGFKPNNAMWQGSVVDNFRRAGIGGGDGGRSGSARALPTVVLKAIGSSVSRGMPSIGRTRR